jgi:hypothetical protein
LDKFPEAFKRFEQVVDVSKIETFQQLLTAFQYWAGKKWKETPKQVKALKVEAIRLGIAEVPVTIEEYWAEVRHRDLLLYRIRLDIGRIKHWEGVLGSTQIWANRLKRYYKDLYVKYAEPELKRISERLEYWKQQRELHYQQAKEETERLRRKRLVLPRGVSYGTKH